MKKNTYDKVVYHDLEDKTVFITGANRGIGKHLCEAFLRNNCRVICVYRKTKPVFSLGKVTKHEPILLKADINDIEKIASFVDAFTSSGNSCNIIINNAGLYNNIPLMECTQQDWCETIDTNLKSMFFLSQLFARQMKKNRKGGVIINAASFTTTMPSVGYGLYSISKGAIFQMTKCIAAEWAPYNIRANTFSPGIVKTRMTAQAIENHRDEVLGAICMNRTGTFEEINNGVLFLASDASSYITGQNLNINGGKFIVQNPHAAWNNQSV